MAWYSFGGFLGNVVAGVVVLWIGYLWIEKKLHLRERATRAEEAEAHRRQTREAVLRSVHGELESNAAKITSALGELEKQDQRILYPLFDLTMWPIVSSAGIFTTLQQSTANALIPTYNRMATANEQNAVLLDFTQGPTSIIVTSTVASSIDNELVADTYGKFLAYRDLVRVGVIERLKELKPNLDLAIDAVESELGIQAEHPAGQRVYEPDVPARFIGEHE